ncbi:hypothetical protein CDL12_02810 [Handroanthus impetiginosus]|uniref:S-protein homolog n=1 Tax=Handroanthus impetiginosus TaxID=429701 RepID=A0A2G9I3Y5_9LAMI|nr:hypothetical protein CDL12_02810 [Handroanthus impetiginosus]
MRHTTVSIPLLLILIWTNHIQVIAQEKVSCPFTEQFNVYIINKLPPNSGSLELHCASGDDDLGTHKLTFGQDFHWKFCESFLANTLYFCHFWWGSKERAFNTFNSKWKERSPTDYLYWEVRSDGFYLAYNRNDAKSFKKYADWQNRKG